MDRLRERLEIAQKALVTLRELLVEPEPSKVVRDAAIQRFEYTVEAVWKAAQRYLRDAEGVEAGSPKRVVRAFREVGILTDHEATLALEMVDDRNLTVHTYNEVLADRIWKSLPAYARLLGIWLTRMHEAGE